MASRLLRASYRMVKLMTEIELNEKITNLLSENPTQQKQSRRPYARENRVKKDDRLLRIIQRYYIPHAGYVDCGFDSTIRDDEVAAEAMGINLARHKRLAFCISSFFAGVGGGLFAMFANQAQAKVFTTAMTYEILLIVVIGGIGSISGSCIAAFLYVAASEWWLRFLDAETYIGSFKVPFLRTGFRMVVFSVIIMVVVLFFRKGIMGDKELPDLLKKRQKKATKEAVQP